MFSVHRREVLILSQHSDIYKETVERYCNILDKNMKFYQYTSGECKCFECFHREECEKSGGCKHHVFKQFNSWWKWAVYCSFVRLCSVSFASLPANEYLLTRVKRYQKRSTHFRLRKAYRRKPWWLNLALNGNCILALHFLPLAFVRLSSAVRRSNRTMRLYKLPCTTEIGTQYALLRLSAPKVAPTNRTNS